MNEQINKNQTGNMREDVWHGRNMQQEGSAREASR